MTTPKRAIKAKCKDCIYDPLAGGTWLQQIEGCVVMACPLWPIRPLTEATRKAGKPKGEIPKGLRKHAA
jgi:hypothetical protein